MDGTGKLFPEFIPALPRGANAVVVTYPLDQPLGYTELEAFARQKLPTQPFILVGESFSGPIAVAIAAADPATVRALVLVGSFVRRPIETPRWLQAVLVAVPIWRVPIALTSLLAFGRWSSVTALATIRCHVRCSTGSVACPPASGARGGRCGEVALGPSASALPPGEVRSDGSPVRVASC